jgi:hypothetical protein
MRLPVHWKTETLPEVGLIRYTALLFLLIFAGCRNENGSQITENSDYSPVIVINFMHTGVSPGLPWDISPDQENLSASMLLESIDGILLEFSSLVRDAIDSGLLVAVVSDSLISYDLGSDHMQVWVDSSGNVRALPEELLEEIPASEWMDKISRQDILLQLFDRFKPDLVVMNFRDNDVNSVLQISEFWTSPDILTRYSVVIFSFPDDHHYRGWCVLAGDMINGTTPFGLTGYGLISTVRLIAGLDWIDDLPQRIPAISILTEPGDIWSCR